MAGNIWFEAAVWIGLAFAASLISIKLGISVALIEILTGVLAGNFLGVNQTTPWIDFLAIMGSVSITFLSGAEIDPQSLRTNLKASLLIGFFSFAVPFAGVWMFAQFVLGWGLQQAQIAGISLSTTSVAVVYAVMIEKGLSKSSLGKMILAACFVTDLGTVLALGIIFAQFNIYVIIFIAALAAAMFIMPKGLKILLNKFSAKRVSQPEIKFILLILFLMAGLAVSSKSEAVLPAYLLGLVVAGVFVKDKTLINRMRTITFTFFVPFYFIKAGIFVSLSAVWVSIGVICLLLVLKIMSKTIGVWPLSRGFKLRTRESNYTTLLMSTGLTFGTISAQFGLTNKIIDQTQYTILVAVVILSAVIPTLIAQRFFEPSEEAMLKWGMLNGIKNEKTEVIKEGNENE